MRAGERVPSRLHDRREAGRWLADRLASYAVERPIVLGLPRGGIPVAFEIAERLRAPLDVLIVRKIGAPDHPEYGLGAVVEGGYQYLDLPRVRAAGYTVEDLRPTIEAELAEVERRSRAYREDRSRVDVRDRFVIVVDDGVATGGTVIAAIRALRAARARRILIALGVAPRESRELLVHEADEVVVLLVPPQFLAVGEWYDEFSPVSDGEVVRLLRRSR